jgi:hypothetical protein
MFQDNKQIAVQICVALIQWQNLTTEGRPSICADTACETSQDESPELLTQHTRQLSGLSQN